jgi:hypothetical protein
MHAVAQFIVRPLNELAGSERENAREVGSLLARREQHALAGRDSDDHLLVNAQLIEQELQSV